MRRSAALIVLAALALLLGSPLAAATFEVGAVPAEESLGPAVEVPGILAPVRVHRDVHDVPHIFARNDRDALFALGRAHARDRFFQMDLLRRTFSGTLAELVGGDALDSDVQLRTLGLRRAAAASLPALSTAARAWLNAYSRGVNSWLRDPANPLPPEYTALELTRAGIPAWTPVDSLVIAKGLAFGLSFDLGDIDLTVALDAFRTAGEAAAFDGTALFSQDIYRSAPFDPAVSIPGFLSGSSPARGQGPLSRWRERDRERVDGIKLSFVPPRGLALLRRYRAQAGQVPLLRRAFEHREGARGSNWWVARGNVTASGRPLLANDPHLALDTPAIFYEAQLRVSGGERPAMNAFGVTFPGIPGIVLGCNPRICWGATTNPMDVTDVYLERLALDLETGLPAATLFDGRPEPLVFVPQAFRVNQVGNGALNDLADAGIGPLEGGVTLLVPRRNNGPIVGIDISEPSQPLAISVQYTGWGATRELLDAFRTWNRAGSIPEFVAGLQFFDVGSQNWAYADVAGNIAYFTSAENPLREDLQNLERADGGTPPWLIRDGSHTLRHEWLRDPSARPGVDFPFRSLPFAEMPQVVNPARGWIANANQDPVGTTLDNDPLDQERRGGQGLFYLAPGYEPGFRMGRIVRLLEAELARDGSFSADDFKRFQANNQLLDAEVLTPHLLAAFQRATRPGASAGLAALAADPRVAEAVGRLRTWDWSTPTGILEGWDPGDGDGSPLLTPQEIANSVAATIYAVWRGEVVRRTIDRTLADVGLSDFAPDGGQALTALRHHLESFPQNGGVGASGLQIFQAPGAASPAEARDLTLLGSLQAALDKLASAAFAPAFDTSTNQNDYRWGLLHRIVFDHPLGGPFSIPPRGLFPLSPDLPGVARAGGFGAVDASSHNVRADSVNEFMFGSGPARRFVGELRAGGPVAEEVIPGGTSGVLGSPFQTDQLILWLTNRYHPWPWKPNDVADAARTTETLEPATP